ncbi:MAG: 16S rRNA (adenine(1518)-N(6)/adenine(1519)-N(6))-dimethyltransferase RsmA [bacterium]
MMALKSFNLSISHPKKSLGQNFLMHTRIADRIANTAKITSDSIVLEIGPGKGILTHELLKRAKKVIAVEADRELFEKLQNDFANEITSGRLELIYGDIRTYPLSTTTVINSGYHLVANIPYYLTGEVFRMFLESKNQPSSMTLLVQKEVAERIARSRKESILSLSVKAYGTPKLEFTVPRGAFKPAPKVDSAVLTIRDISRKNFSTRKAEQRFFALIHAGFAHKRKFVRKNLAEANLPLGDIPEKARAEDLPLSVWLTLSKVEKIAHNKI